MRTLLFLTLTASLGVAAAQTSKGGVAALPTPDGAYLRWYLPGDVLPIGGFTLRLNGPGGVRTVAVSSPQPYTAALGLSRTDYDSLIDTYKSPIKSDSERTQRAFFGLGVVARPAYARALGIMTTLRDLKPGQYTVTVTALGSPANGTQTKVGEATFTTAPLSLVPTPGLPRPKAAPAAVQLSWPVPAAASSKLVVAYNVYRATGTGPFALLKPAPFFLSSQPGGDVFKDNDLTAKTTYRYQVASVDLFGRESERTAPVSVTTETVTVLPAPDNLEASVKERAVTLRWTPAKDSRIIQQLVVRGTDPSQPLTVLATLKPGEASYTDATGRAGEPYVYAVVARDAGGLVGARSSLISARPVNTRPPATPSGVKIKAGESALALSWNANPEEDVRGYQVYRSESEGPGAPALLVNTAPITGTTFTDPLSAGLQNRYFYRVTALNTSETESLRSGAVSSTLIDKTPPPAPALLPFTVSAQGVKLSWTQAELPDLAGFRVLRSAAGSAPVELGRLKATERTYLDATAEAGVTFTYSVQSVDAAGNVSASSEPVAIRRTRVGLPDAPKRVEVGSLGAGLGNRVVWTAVSGISVVVYRLDAAGSEPLQISGMTTTGVFVDAQGTPDSQYQLRAVDERGQVSAFTPPQPVAKQ
ncbi:fibronectin type III domain-containing protein [Deinococcus altitudinis]|uniref:fibronectin type III domain-containing protein n=1 Tax=Deinococcus altitudinis TaxID=468914 RepID=UPI0038923635